MSCALYDSIIINWNIDDAIQLYHLYHHALEVDGQPALQFVHAHVEKLDSLGEINVWTVMFVEEGQAVVSGQRRQSTTTILQ